jgi:uncharacterized membrane protein
MKNNTYVTYEDLRLIAISFIIGVVVGLLFAYSLYN